MDKLISVVIPVYNVETTLRKCVDSVLAQTYDNTEVILVNDGSTDRSEDICRSYEQIDPRVKVISKENGGLSSARNAGIDKSCGEYIFFIDSDDWIDSDTLEVLLNAALQKGTDVTGCCVYFNFPNGVENSRTSDEIYIQDTRALIKWMLAGSIYANAAWGKLFKRSIFEKLRFDESCDFCEDDEFSFRMAHIAKGYLRIADAKYHYFQNSGGMVLSGTYISDTPINVMSKIESDPIVAGDPELSRLAHKKKIAALHTLYVKYMRAGDRRNAVRIAHMMRELVKARLLRNIKADAGACHAHACIPAREIRRAFLDMAQRQEIQQKICIKGNRTQQKYCVRFLFNFYLAAVRLFYIPDNKMRTLLDEVVESGQLARIGAAVTVVIHSDAAVFHALDRHSVQRRQKRALRPERDYCRAGFWKFALESLIVRYAVLGHTALLEIVPEHIRIRAEQSHKHRAFGVYFERKIRHVRFHAVQAHIVIDRDYLTAVIRHRKKPVTKPADHAESLTVYESVGHRHIFIEFIVRLFKHNQTSVIRRDASGLDIHISSHFCPAMTSRRFFSSSSMSISPCSCFCLMRAFICSWSRFVMV